MRKLPAAAIDGSADPGPPVGAARRGLYGAALESIMTFKAGRRALDVAQNPRRRYQIVIARKVFRPYGSLARQSSNGAGMPDDLEARRVAALQNELANISERLAEALLRNRRPIGNELRLVEQLTDRKRLIEVALESLRSVRTNRDLPPPELSP
jgi:hypothetical protein